MAEINTEELAVQPEFVWEHFTIRDGLPDMKIECIYEDSQGLVWVGTHEGGLACYDGHRFTTYSSEDGLAGNGVFSAIEDDSGYMWFGTNRGLSRFDGSKFETILLDGESRSYLWGRCKDRKGRLWFGLEREPNRDPAICCWDGNSLEEVVLAELGEEDEDLGESINAMDVDEKGRVWCGGSKLYVCMLKKYKNEYKRFIIIKAKKNYPYDISSIICTVDKNIIGFYHGFASYGDDANTEQIWLEKSIEVNDLLYDQMSDDYYSLLGSGCIELMSLKGEKKHTQHNMGRFWKGSISSDGTFIWIGTYGTGLYRLLRDRVNIYRQFSNVTSMTVDSTDILLFCCQNGVVRFNSINNKYNKISAELSEDVSISEYGVNISISNRKLQEYKSRIYELERIVCCCAINLQADCLIVGTLFGHIYMIDSENKVIKAFITQNDNQKLFG